MARKISKVRPESDLTYTNKFSKKTLTFKPRADEVMVTFKDAATSDTALKLMRTASLGISRGIDYQRGFACMKVSADTTLAGAMNNLTQSPDVANALPVMIDPEGLTRFFLPDEFTVQFKPEIPKDRALELIHSHGCDVLVEQRTPGYYTLTVPDKRGLFEMIREFTALDQVAFAEPSEAGFNDALLYLPDDPEFPKLWGLHNTGQTVNGVAGTADADIDAADAWDLERGSATVVVAVVDSGADLDHPDLQANFLARGAEDWDFADGPDGSPDDADGHGTHVAGIAAGADNAAGIIGVAPKCSIMPLRVNLTTGMNQNRADAINYVGAQALANPGRRYVINCSWKMNGDHAGVHSAIINAVNNNVAVVFAAGNFNLDISVTPQYPAIYPEVICVAATNQRDVRATFSNYGSQVSVCAPGVNIYSTFPDNSYTYLDGTSMSSPYVAGLAALIRSRNRDLTVAQVRGIMETSADNIAGLNPGFAGKLGAGRINAYRALWATPAPKLAAKIIAKYDFPQKNNGSSSALGLIRKIVIHGVARRALMFLTQQPYSERIFYLNPETGAVYGSVDPAGNDTIGSLEWDGMNICVANVTVGAGFINTIHPVTGVQLGSRAVPPGRGEALAYNGTAGVFYYSTETRIHIIRNMPWGVIRSFVPPGGPCRALAFGKNLLFSGTAPGGLITVFDPSTLFVKGTIDAPGGGTNQAEGLAYDATLNRLYVANQSENAIYVLQLSV